MCPHVRVLPLTAAIVAAAAACTPPPEAVTTCTAGAPLDAPLCVLETDWSASALARVDPRGCATERGSVELGADPALSPASGRLFVAARDADEILEVDPSSCMIARGRRWKVPGGHANPWRVVPGGAAAPGTLWVLRYNLPALAVLGEDGSLAGEVDLGSFDPDGAPEMADAVVAGGQLVVALQRLDTAHGSDVVRNGTIAIVDMATRQLAGQVDLVGRDPVALAVDPADGSSLLVADLGRILHPQPGDEAFVGVERVSLATRTSGWVVHEAALGGAPGEMIVAGAREAYAIVADRSDPKNPTRLVRFDPATGEVGPALAATGCFCLSGLAATPAFAAVGDKSGGRKPRVRLFSRADGREAAPAVDLSLLPPVDLVAP